MKRDIRTSKVGVSRENEKEIGGDDRGKGCCVNGTKKLWLEGQLYALSRNCERRKMSNIRIPRPRRYTWKPTGDSKGGISKQCANNPSKEGGMAGA